MLLGYSLNGIVASEVDLDKSIQFRHHRLWRVFYVFVAAGHRFGAVEVFGRRSCGRLALVVDAGALRLGGAVVDLGDASGYTKRKAAEKIEKRKQERIERQKESLGLRPRKPR